MRRKTHGGADTETHWYKLFVRPQTSFLLQVQFDQQVEMGGINDAGMIRR